MKSLKLFKPLKNGDLITNFIERRISKSLDKLLDPYEADKRDLPMTVYISQKQANKPCCIEVSRYCHEAHNGGCCSQAIFSMTVPRNQKETSRIIGDTGEIRLLDIVKADKFIRLNSDLLWGVWNMTSDNIVDKYYYYWDHIRRLTDENFKENS